jgi:hypothetical protein
MIQHVSEQSTKRGKFGYQRLASVLNSILDKCDLGDLLGNESVIKEYEARKQVYQGIWVKSRECNARCRFVKPFHVPVGTEEPYAALIVLVRFHSLEGGERIVEYASGRVEREILIWSYVRS